MNKDRGQIRKKEENYRKKKKKKKKRRHFAGAKISTNVRSFSWTVDRRGEKRFSKRNKRNGDIFYRISRQAGKLSLSAGFYKPDRFVAASLIALSCFFRVD